MLTAEHVVKDFSCGMGLLNRFLKRYALANQAEGLGTTYVLAGPGLPEPSVVLGYYTIAPSKVELDVVPDSHRRSGEPKYSRPTYLLARLAVDRRQQGKKLGWELLRDAMLRTYRLARSGGGVALEVDALTDDAKSFYLHYGFIPYQDDPRHLFLPMRRIREWFRQCDPDG